ncbi:unnamed protein product [Closterium sp. NIES-53]
MNMFDRDWWSEKLTCRVHVWLPCSALDRIDTFCEGCPEDCMGHIHCQCTAPLRGNWAYTRDGTLTDAFLRTVEMEVEQGDEAERRGNRQFCRPERLLWCPVNAAQLKQAMDAMAQHHLPGDAMAPVRLGDSRARALEACVACPGHPVRTFIKECFVKCRCGRTCGNRVVQRGITRRLEVTHVHNCCRM